MRVDGGMLLTLLNNVFNVDMAMELQPFIMLLLANIPLTHNLFAYMRVSNR